MTHFNFTRACAAGFSLTALASLLIACSSGGDTASPVSPTPLSGTLVDGYIVGASVGEVNASNTCIPSTDVVTSGTSGKTGKDGKFTLPNYQGSVLCATGGTDGLVDFTNKELRAPANSKVITPLTTLVQAQLAASSALTARTAADNLAKTLGLTGVDLLTADPVATAPTTTASAASTLIQVTAAVQKLLDSLGTTYSEALRGLASALAQQTAQVKLDGTGTTLATLIQTAASVAGVPAASAAANAAAIRDAVIAKAAQIPASLATPTTTLAGTSTTTSTSSGATTTTTTTVAGGSTTTTVTGGSTTTTVTGGSTTTATTATSTTTTLPLAPLTTLAVSLPTINTPALTPTGSGSTADPYVVTVGTTGITSASLTLNGTAATSSTTSVGFDITEVGTVCDPLLPPTPGCVQALRKLTLIVDKVSLTQSGSNFTGLVGGDAKLYASATGHNGTIVSVVQPQTNAASNNLTFNGNVLSVAWSGALSNALTTAGLGSTLNLSKGTYDVSVVVKGVTLTGSNVATGVAIPAIGAASVPTGDGVKFRVTVN